MAYNIFKLYNHYKNLSRHDDLNNKIEDLVTESIEKVDDEYFLDKLRKDYPDIVAYIDIAGTNISYPIVQSGDNTFYMNHSVDKSYNGNGSIFLDYRNMNDFSDDNSILYGHFIKSGKLFYDLDKFRKQEFYNANKTIKLSTLDGEKSYTIYSVYVADPNEDYRMQNFKNLDAKTNFLKKIKSKSIIKTLDLDLDGKNILSLSTCSDRGNNRLVIHALEE